MRGVEASEGEVRFTRRVQKDMAPPPDIQVSWDAQGKITGLKLQKNDGVSPTAMLEAIRKVLTAPPQTADIRIKIEPVS